tara:strand:- start:5009 stop:5560 length:552 start_codon:yes stop_codon:yes gene_type:complete
MKTIKITLLLMIFTIASFSQIELVSKDSLYVNPQNLGLYPNATLDYVGEVHDGHNKTFNFVFELRTQDSISLSKHSWGVSGETPQGNIIKNHGWVRTGVDSLSYQNMDIIAYFGSGGTVDNPDLVILEHPQLSYDDIVSYFVLGSKLDKAQLPVANIPKKVVQWMFLNQININGEMMKEQFQF